MSIDPQEMGSCCKFDCCGDLGHPNPPPSRLWSILIMLSADLQTVRPKDLLSADLQTPRHTDP